MKNILRKCLIILIIIILIFNNYAVFAEENVTDTSNIITAEKYFNIFDMLRISGNEDTRYYYEFRQNKLNELLDVINSNNSIFRAANLDMDTLKAFIQAQAASELPNLGGKVTSTNPISTGKESDVSGRSVLKVTSYDDVDTTSSSNFSGDFMWPVKAHETAEARAASVVSLCEFRGMQGVDDSNGGYHNGLDICEGADAEIVAVADGKVLHAGWKDPNESFGYGVIIEHETSSGEKYVSCYAHNSSVTVSPGDTVKQGQVIAKMGSTGLAFGVHLHFEIWKDQWWSGELVNPLDVYDSSYVNGNMSYGSGQHIEGGKTGGNSSISFVASTNSTSVSFANTKDTTQAAQNILNSEITVSSSTERFNSERLNGGVILRRIMPDKEFGEEFEQNKKEINYHFAYESYGTKRALPETLASKLGISSQEYSLLYIPYLNFDEDINIGKMIVNSQYADEVLEIFYTLFANKYMIEKIHIPEEYVMDLGDDTIAYSSLDKAQMEALAYITNVTIPSEDDENYTQVMNSLYEETYVYYKLYLNQFNRNFTGERYTDSNELTEEYKAHLNSQKIEYALFKTKNEYADLFQKAQAEFDLKKDSEHLIERTSGISGSLEDKNILDNNTYCYMAGNDGLELTVNPYYNPQTDGTNPTMAQIPTAYGAFRPSIEKMTLDEISHRFVEDSETIEYFENLKWEWQGHQEDEEGKIYNFAKFVRNVEAKEDTPKKEKIIDSKVFDLSYVPFKRFNSYIEQGDQRVLYHYTIGPDGFIYTAIWQYSKDSEGNTTMVYKPSSPISFYQALYPYEMSVEFLNSMIMIANDKDFAVDFANLGAQSTYIVAIEDQVTIKKTTDNNTDKVSVTETVSEIQEVLYVDCWFTRYVKCLVEDETSQLYSPLFIDILDPNNVVVIPFIAAQRVSYSKNNSYGKSANISGNAIIQAADEVHKLIEKYNFTYDQNDSATIEEAIEKGKYTTVCSIYVNWVLKKVGLELPDLMCERLADKMSSLDWVEQVDEKDIQPGDLILWRYIPSAGCGHICIYAGLDDDGRQLFYDGGVGLQFDYSPCATGMDVSLATCWRVKQGSSNATSTPSVSSSNTKVNINTEKIQFVGDSWIAGLLASKQYDSTEEYLYGVGGESSLSQSMQLETVIGKVQSDAEAIVCNLGLNNTSETAAKATLELLEGLHKKFNVPVYQLKVQTVASTYSYGTLTADIMNENIKKYNQIVEDGISKLDGVYFIDVTDKFTDTMGYFNSKYASSDGFHFNSASGYKEWYQEILTKIKNGNYGSSANYTSETQTFTYTNAKDYVTGNSDGFVKLYMNSSAEVKSSLQGDVVEEMLKDKSVTFTTQKIVRYLLYKANQVNVKSTTLVWTDFLPDQFKKKEKKKLETDIDEKFIFFMGVLEEGACEGSRFVDGKNYGVEIFSSYSPPVYATAFGLTQACTDILMDIYPDFKDDLYSGSLPMDKVQEAYIYMLEYYRDQIIGEDGQGGLITDPSILDNEKLYALMDMYHYGPAYCMNICSELNKNPNMSDSAIMDLFVANYGGGEGGDAIVQRARCRAKLYTEGKYYLYSAGNSEIEFTSETPWSDFVDGTPSSELYEVLGNSF